ncbi:related to PUF3-transcript-specific regulator of mRNA degradation [Ustilago bromivora]|uniref:Pumilio homology domain family member 3 n=1 Tax=Ustilago bromivora TaxID=307758 RepID=A0A1K0FVB3_9BASI|nr:related to PUF3-transcript-specific regulator of mRNA degradation [Ustilago bromivora]
MSKLDQSAWSANTGSPSSVWNGRAPSTLDADAVTTASTSNVSTPIRGPTALDAKDVSANAPVFTPSPLLPQEGSAWSIQPPGSLTWANELTTRPPPTDLISESASSSPNAVKRVAVKDPPSAPNPSSSPCSALESNDTADSNAANASPTNVAKDCPAKPAAPVPKRAPIRSVTLDPSHLASKSRLSDEIHHDPLPSGQAAASQDEELVVDGMNTLTIATDSSAALHPVGFQSPPPPLIGVGGHHHMHRPSASFPPPPFSPGGEVFMHPSPYLPGSGARSPDGYTHGYPGVTHMLPGMAPIDMSGYESYRTTPDPYAPTMPGRAIFASPGSQGSTPQSPSFGPASMRNGEALFYPGVVPGFAPPPHMQVGMASPVRPLMAPASAQYAFRPAGVDSRSSQLAPSPMIPPGMPIPVMGGIMLPPTSPSMAGGGADSRGSPALSQSSPYSQGPHRRMGSGGAGEPFGPGMTMSPRHPFAMAPNHHQAGPFVMGGGPMMGWNAHRFHDHRRVPTGPGGVMAPVGGYGGAPSAIDPNFVRNGGGFYSAPFPPPHHHHHHHHHHPASHNGTRSSNGGPHHSRSPLLEEFRSRHSKNRQFELADICGSVVEFSSDQHGSRFIQEKLDSASDEEKKLVFHEVLPQARQLMTNVFGNYVIQKMLEHGDEEQRDVLGREMEGHILSLSLGTYGCRVVQKAFDHISASQREKLAAELDGHIMQCVRDQNANHVVQKVIERVHPSKMDFIPKAFIGQVASLASHCYSCRVLQKCFECCEEGQTRALLEELHAEAFGLMQHQYGNYVIQWVLQSGKPYDRVRVISKIKGSVLTLSRHKFASNVIEQVIRTCNSTDRNELLEEILTATPLPSPYSPEENTANAAGPSPCKIAPAVLMMKDQFANYVLQRFLEKADTEQRSKLIDLVHPSLIAARKGGMGITTKHLVAIERLIDVLLSKASAAGGGAAGGQN